MSTQVLPKPITLIGHDRQLDWFRNAIKTNRLASTFLFVGPEGIGKRTFALYLAQSLFCERNPKDELKPCGECPSCIQVKAGTHPDILRMSQNPKSARTFQSSCSWGHARLDARRSVS